MAKNDLYKVTDKQGNTYVLEIKWGVSRGRDSYGYTTCSAWVDGKKVGSCNGGGYDLAGTAVDPWVSAFLTEAQEKEYGVHKREDGTYYIDGGTGFSHIMRVAELTLVSL